jgi:hypothetical protein
MVTLARPKAPLVAAKSTKARGGRDLTQASGKAGLAQAFATAFDPVPRPRGGELQDAFQPIATSVRGQSHNGFMYHFLRPFCFK